MAKKRPPPPNAAASISRSHLAARIIAIRERETRKGSEEGMSAEMAVDTNAMRPVMQKLIAAGKVRTEGREGE